MAIPKRISAAAALLLLASCQAEVGHLPGADFNPAVTTRDPAILVSLVASTTTPEESRMSADRLLAEKKGKTDETRLSVLEQLLYAPGHSDRMRIYALDQLADADPARAGHALMLYLPRFEGEVLAHATAMAATLGDQRLIDPLIRSLARWDGQGALEARPETKTLEQLATRPLIDTLFDRLAQSKDRSLRSDALDLLAVIGPVDSLKARIAALSPPASPSDPWLADLRWWIATFDTLPSGEAEMRWVQFLHRPEQAPLVNRALERHRRLREASDYHVAPRFIHVLAYADDAAVQATRIQLLATIKQQLGERRIVDRVPENSGSPDDQHTALDAQESKLSRGDLLAIHLLLRGLADRRILEELHRQGLADMSDTATEQGGLLSFQNVDRPALWAIPYPPLFASNDFQYLTGDKLLLETAAGVAQYHFHFQQVRNEARAGPGTGDLAYAHTTRCNCVVITSIGPGTMDIDFYTPEGAVVDLGVYPTAPSP
jgi:hypothetical protein